MTGNVLGPRSRVPFRSFSFTPGNISITPQQYFDPTGICIEMGIPVPCMPITALGDDRIAADDREPLKSQLALVPLMIDAGAPGKEILNPVAVTIFGGLISSTLLDTFLTPVLFLRYGRKPLECLVDAARKDQDDARAPIGAEIQTF